MNHAADMRNFTGSGIYFISESLSPDPTWETHNFKFSQIKHPFFNHEPPVILLHASPEHTDGVFKILQEIRDLKMQTQVILFGCRFETSKIIEVFNLFRPHSILKTTAPVEIEPTLRGALETARKMKQDNVLLELFNEQNLELQKVSKDLEVKIEKRQRHLEETRGKLFTTNKKISFLQECLFTIHNSTDIADLEHRVTTFLADAFQLSLFRIVFSSPWTNNLAEQNLSIYYVPLTQGGVEYGALLFARSFDNPFRREDKDFLDQICEAIALCIDRMLQIERNHDLQSQWQSTFNSISTPAVLIDSDYNVRIANRGVVKKSPDAKKCYQMLFGLDAPCTDCRRGEPFRLRDQKDSSKIFDVFSQSITVDYQKNYFHLYRNVSKQLGFERQLVESAKLAELGTISSSIAHELNNPLGGMLNFIQLIKMDLKGNEPYYADILEMEAGANKCKNIVQNLLGFSRNSQLSETQRLDVMDVLQRSLMITELRTRALGIQIAFQSFADRIFVQARFNPLAQVFCNVLQNAYESIIEKRKATPNFHGRIQIDVGAKGQTLFVEIQDDGIGLSSSTKEHIFDPLFTTKDPDKHSGLGLTLAAQILKEHDGQIDVSSQKDGKTCVSIRFPRFDLN